MARHASPKNAEFIAGPVRVTEGKYGFRILWTERKRQRERTAPTLEAAKEVAMAEAARLMSENPDVLSRRSAVFATLVSRASDPETHTWSPEWANRVERIARLHVIPALGSLDCDRMTRDHVQRFLNGLAAEGYSRSFITHVRNLVAAAVREGVRHGIWDFGRDPMDGVTLPRVEEGSSGKPDLDLIPSDDQVLRLIQVLTADRAVLGTMSTVAAFTGVRLVS